MPRETQLQFKREFKLQHDYSICCIIETKDHKTFEKINSHIETLELIFSGVNPQKYISMKKLYSRLIQKLDYNEKNIQEANIQIKLLKGKQFKSGINVSYGKIIMLSAYKYCTDTSCILYNNGSVIFLSPNFSRVQSTGNDGVEHCTEIGSRTENDLNYLNSVQQKLRKELFA